MGQCQIILLTQLLANFNDSENTDLEVKLP